MNAMIKSTSHDKTRPYSSTARAQAGDNRSNALLWSISKTAHPPGAKGRSRLTGSPQALAIGPNSAMWSSSFG
eukprot:14330051-Alexandrium_andersonii.AAC.1